MRPENNPEFIEFEGELVRLDDLLKSVQSLREENTRLHKEGGKALKKFRQFKELVPYEAELIKLQEHLEKYHKRMIIVFEGRDAAGKGGAIRRVTHYMNERHYRVVALGRPSEVQRSQWYFQKYIERFPRGGEIVLFDRSWYNRAMVEPVFGFCSDQEHKNFMRGVVGFEKDFVRQGTIFIKLYMSVTREEQEKRFEIRKTNPLKQWKLSEVDLQMQELWDEFTRRKYEMLKRTHTSQAPWTVVRANDKHRARLNVMRVILKSVDYERRDMSLNYVPDDDIVLSGARELELMQEQLIRYGKFIS
jgi:polyphosphate kinase 2